MLDTLKSSRIPVALAGLVTTVPSKLTQALATLLAVLFASVVLVDSIGKVIEPADGVVEKVPVVADVIIPFALTVKNGIAVTLPYVPAVAPLVASVAVPLLIVKSPARVVDRFPIVPVVLFSVAIVPVVLLSVAIVPVVLLSVAIVPVVLAKLVIVPLVIVAAVEVVVPAVRLGIAPVVIVPVVIVALAETNLVPVAVP